MEFDLDKALEEVPIHVEDPLPVAPPPPAASPLDGPWPAPSDLPAPPTLAELPPALEHRTKSRPKPRKRTRPSRPAVGGHQGAESLTAIIITVRDNSKFKIFIDLHHIENLSGVSGGRFIPL